MNPLDCEGFRQRIYHFQAGELSEEERRSYLEHMERCSPCARRAETEESFARFLRAHLRREPAPPALKARVRAALEREAPGGRRGFLPRPVWSALAAAAATLILAFALGPSLPGPGPDGIRAGEVVHVERAATIVDLQCDRAGKPFEYQFDCRHAAHFNAFRIADGQYWQLSLGQELAHEIVTDPTRRGQRVTVEGDYYPALGTLRVRTIRPREMASL